MPCSIPTEQPGEVGAHQWACRLTDEEPHRKKRRAICPGTHSWSSDSFCSVSPALGDSHKRTKKGLFMLIFVLIMDFLLA